jgi:hypothetical protein
MSKGKLDPLPAAYDRFLKELKDRIRLAQVRSALSVDRELVVLYWSIGHDILIRQKKEGWGAKIIDTAVTRFNEVISRRARLSGQELEIHARLC